MEALERQFLFLFSMASLGRWDKRGRSSCRPRLAFEGELDKDCTHVTKQ